MRRRLVGHPCFARGMAWAARRRKGLVLQIQLLQQIRPALERGLRQPLENLLPLVQRGEGRIPIRRRFGGRADGGILIFVGFLEGVHSRERRREISRRITTGRKGRRVGFFLRRFIRELRRTDELLRILGNA
jgi:hypothetical protein